MRRQLSPFVNVAVILACYVLACSLWFINKLWR